MVSCVPARVTTGNKAMIHVVEGVNAACYQAELDEMFRQRAYVFQEKLGWDVTVDKFGHEKDKYDTPRSVYLLKVDKETSEVLGSLRLVSTMGPTLLRDVFSDTLPSDYDFEAPSVWECTRFAVDDRKLEGRTDGMCVSRVASELLFAIGEIGISAGISTIVGNFAPPMIRIYRRAGCKVDVLGKSEAYSVPVYLGAFEVAEHVLDGMRTTLDIAGSILAPRRKPVGYSVAAQKKAA